MDTRKMTAAQLQQFEAILDEFEKYRDLTDDEKQQVIRAVMSGTFMDLRSDFAFKHIMQDTEILKMLLNDILPEPVDKITPQPNEIDRLFAGDKDATMDVVCESGDRKFIVEIQQKRKSDFKNRMYYYGAAMSQSQIKSGSPNYSILLPVYVICFMDFRFQHQADRLIYRYALRDEDSGELYGNQLNIYFCELPRLRKRSMGGMNPLEGWLYLFRNLHKFAEAPEGMDKRFVPVLASARMNSLPTKEQIQYFRSMISEDEKKILIESGYEYGLEDGAEKKAIEIARQMLAEGLSVELIARVTGLSEEEIERL